MWQCGAVLFIVEEVVVVRVLSGITVKWFSNSNSNNSS